MSAASLGAPPPPVVSVFLSEQCQAAWDSYGTPTLANLCRRKIQCQNLAQESTTSTVNTKES